MDHDSNNADSQLSQAPPADQPGAPRRRLAKARSNDRRFDRFVRLVTVPGFRLLESAHIVVVGVGGVGGYAAEGLARSGVGRITLIDNDVVCATNVNRQIQATSKTVGQSKVALLAARLREINPALACEPIEAFYCAENADELLPLDDPPTFVVDAIDHVTTKLDLLDRCRRNGIPVVSSMGAAGRLDPTAVRVTDLFLTREDPLARVLRKTLRSRHGWPLTGPHGRPEPCGVKAVYSVETRRRPVPPAWDDEFGFQCICPHGDDRPQACSHRNLIEGSAGFVTSVFGMAAASVVIREIVGEMAAPTEQERGQVEALAAGKATPA